MSEESERFLRELVDGAERLTAHEMVESFEDALAAISAGHGTVAWRDGEPIGGHDHQQGLQPAIEADEAAHFDQ